MKIGSMDLPLGAGGGRHMLCTVTVLLCSTCKWVCSNCGCPHCSMLLSGEMLSMLTYGPVLLSIYAAAVADGVSTLHER